MWRVPSAYGEMAHDPAANANGTMVYFLTADYRLRKIRGTDGHVVWDVPVGAPRRTPPGWNAVLSGGSVIVTKVDLFAFDTTTGAERWSYVAPDLDETGYWPVVVDDSTVYATTPMTRVYAIDARTGVARWIVDLSEGTEDNGAMPPVLADSTLYVCTRTVAYPPAGVLWAIDARTGGVRWRHAFTPELPQQPPTCYGHAAIWRDLVIQPQGDGRVFAFDRATGAVRWIAPRVHDVGISISDNRYPAAGESGLLVTSGANEGMIVAYEPATGLERWRYRPNGGSLYPPVIEGNTAYVDHGWFFASYDMRTGAVRWQVPQSIRQPSTTLKGRPVVAGDRIFVAGRDGSYALTR